MTTPSEPPLKPSERILGSEYPDREAFRHGQGNMGTIFLRLLAYLDEQAAAAHPVAVSSAGEGEPDASGLYHGKAHVDLPGRRYPHSLCEPAECHKAQTRLIEERDEARQEAANWMRWCEEKTAKLAASEALVAKLEADRETWRDNPDLTPPELAKAVTALKSDGGPDGGPAEMFWAELGDVALDCYAATVSRADHAESCATELAEQLAASEARCNQLTGELEELDTVNHRLHDTIIEPLEAKLTESEAAVARLREELEKREAVVTAAREAMPPGYEDADWWPALEAALSALDQPSQPEPASEPRARFDGLVGCFVGLVAGMVGVCERCGRIYTDHSPGLRQCPHLVSDPSPVSDSAEGVEPTSTRSGSR